MWEQLRRFRALEPGERGLFLRAAAALPLISASLRLRGFRHTQASLQKRITASTSSQLYTSAASKAARTALTVRMVRSAAYKIPGTPTCLEKSLGLWWLLGRQGIASEVRIGARKNGPKFAAHAWVECEGVALNEPEELHKHYAAFDKSFPLVDRAKK
jgi:hypothetical protein